MIVLKFNLHGKSRLLHNGKQFIGGETRRQAGWAIQSNTAVALTVGGFEMLDVTEVELSEMIGGVPYKILDHSGGLGKPFMSVEIVNDNQK